MRALVTGGAGFIGSNLVDALLGRGDEGAIIDDLSTGRERNLEGALDNGATLHRVDIRDADAVRKVFDDFRPETVFHLAAQIDVRKSVEDPAWDSGINVGGTINLLEAARLSGVQRFVNTSTGGGIYRDVEENPTPHDPEPPPMAPFRESKIFRERYCGWARRP